MARTTEFDHDTLAHLLQDNKLKVPNFQRQYAWDDENVRDFWEDITAAYERGDTYFLGTVVLADITDPENRKSIVDGQQRMVTTALTMYAISRTLARLGKDAAAQKIYTDYIADFDLEEEDQITKLTLGTKDQEIYGQIVKGEDLEQLEKELAGKREKSKILTAFRFLQERVDHFADQNGGYSAVTQLSKFLREDAQVLLAVATGLGEAYVIFETLNIRGADLTTADLLKNFFLSSAGDKSVNEALELWTEISSRFDDGEKLVSFIKADFTSRWGAVKVRDLYKELQNQLGRDPKAVLVYLRDLRKSLDLHLALSSPEDPFWSSIATDVRDEIIANRRFRLEVPNAMYLAAMRKWRPKDFCALIKAGTAWSIRATIVGAMGGGTADRIFGDLAAGIADGSLKSVDDVRKEIVSRHFLPSDNQFKRAVVAVDDGNLSRVKYLLAMLDNAYSTEQGIQNEGAVGWDAKVVSVDHIVPKDETIVVGPNGENQVLQDAHRSIANLALLERSVNNRAGNSSFEDKRDFYAESKFELTSKLADENMFSDDAVAERSELFQELAPLAWPV
ncbi:DUF262 domain-containing protein [Corynebacterium sp. CCUG 71335]|uniref:DUF262 domain-containing protein n=1 Tax=Corynebacterium sp. CCUG 71335 TaxID=2823892 RepID=UPI00210BF6A3|nr:DUF262 domain-containing protein [Corynebacterium sp. CCUG 71335]MCQ4619926.1 DUF262 domain-containing protein [Corynebacterium sp. CCUG 71335]